MKNIKHVDWYLEAHVYVVLTKNIVSINLNIWQLQVLGSYDLTLKMNYKAILRLSHVTWDSAYFTTDICRIFVLILLKSGKPSPGATETCGF